MKYIFDIFENSKAKDTNKRNINKHSHTKIKKNNNKYNTDKK